ncbi:serine carboxypeptidase S28-domain-containing protein [Thamnidium elegans]|nr:serine carboxypeptidase S28-domain-containing protein [Thamnidium elegans]
MVTASSLQKRLIDTHVLKKRFQIHSKNVLAPAEGEVSYPVPNEKYGGFFMKMPLDHFNNTGNNKTFYNKYWVNTDHYKPNGPIILYNVGESAADESAILVTNSTMAQLAEKLNGIIIIMEHRFYGSSGPNVTTFFVNLETFNTKQALADMAYIFHNIIVPPVPQTKVIVYGCSYSGSLAAWAKDTYPNLFFATVSSSAPVQADVDFYKYFDPIINYGPKHCVSSLQGVISYIDNILYNGSTSQVTELKKVFYSQNLLDVTFGQSKLYMYMYIYVCVTKTLSYYKISFDGQYCWGLAIRN